MTTEKHPKHGVTLSFPATGEVVMRAYGDFGAEGFSRLLTDAFRIVERDTGKRPAGYLTLDDGVIEVRVSQWVRRSP